MLDKRALSDRDICSKYVTPALEHAGWDPMTQIREELFFTRGRTRDFRRNLVLDERTRLVARRITEFLEDSGDRFQKPIVLCVDQEHAARMRQALVNENDDLVATSPRYVMRITGGGPDGQAQLDNFIDPESTFPVIVTT